MMTDLQEAFREAARREFSMVPVESELDHTFSPGFQRKMQRIIRAQVHGYWNMVNTLGKRIAIAAAIVVMLLTTAMAIKPVRERVIKFFVEVYEEYFEFTFGTDESNDLPEPTSEITQYTFSWMPEGYSEISHTKGVSLIWTMWRNQSGNEISLSQEPGTHSITLNNTAENTTQINHKNLKIAYQLHKNTSTFIWAQDDSIFLLTIYGEVSMDHVFQMIDSLEKIE